MLKHIDRFLNSQTMYKVVLYCLMAVSLFAVLLGFIGRLNYSGIFLLLSFFAFVWSCYFVNILFSTVLKTPSTGESSVISGMILFLIFQPATDVKGFLAILLISFVAMASKYIIVWRKKHLFNPAAFSAVVFGFTNFVAIWWVANIYMLPIVAIAGFIIIRKTRRFYVFLSFLIGFFVTYFWAYGLLDAGTVLKEAFISWPIVFFGTVMLVEPTTMPPRIRQQILYGFAIGLFLGNPLRIIPGVYTTPELTLILGNIASFFLGIKRKIKMVFEAKDEIAQNTYEFTFRPDKRLNFRAGQYLEWSLPHAHQDARGIRRYFTIASAPNDAFVKLGIKFNDYSSSFKKYLLDLKGGEMLYADNLMGDFFLTKKREEKYVFIAGGIGITPFISMLRDLIARNKKTDIIIFYANKTSQDVAYRELLEQAETAIGVKTIYVMDEKGHNGDVDGFLNEAIIKKFAPDFSERIFYLSGPSAMVDNYATLIKNMGVSIRNIRRDYFPGF